MWEIVFRGFTACQFTNNIHAAATIHVVLCVDAWFYKSKIHVLFNSTPLGGMVHPHAFRKGTTLFQNTPSGKQQNFSILNLNSLWILLYIQKWHIVLNINTIVLIVDYCIQL